MSKKTNPNDFYTLSELAESGELPWKDRATIRKYVRAYDDVFKPKPRGVGRGRRYVIYVKDVRSFMEKFSSGELKDIKRVRAGRSRVMGDFVSIVDAGNTKYSYALRQILENKDYRVEILNAKTRRKLMSILGSSVRTHNTLVIVALIANEKIIFDDSSSIDSTTIRRIADAQGIISKNILLCTDSKLPKRFENAFLFHTPSEFSHVDTRSKDSMTEAEKIIEAIGEEGGARGFPSFVYKKRSSKLGRSNKKSA